MKIDKEMQECAIDVIKMAIVRCPYEIIVMGNVKILVPKWFLGLISNDEIKIMGYKLEVGYENCIVIFNEMKNPNDEVFKYKLQ